MAKLGVNVDHVATLREARKTDYPDPFVAARTAVGLGVSCITVHLREDRRHIREQDVTKIRGIPSCRLNMELAADEDVVAFALNTRPEQVTIVPERREELTTEGGLDVAANPRLFAELAKRFQEKGITVSLFIDPEERQMAAAATTGAEAVEINTAEYSETKSERDSLAALARVEKAAKKAKSLGLVVHAGHGLNYENVGPIAAIGTLEELNIGHSIVSRSVYDGFEAAVRSMMRLIESAGKKGGKR